MPPLFDWLKTEGGIESQEMYRVFNCGIGMVIVVPSSEANAVAENLRQAGETVYALGEIAECGDGDAQTVVI